LNAPLRNKKYTNTCYADGVAIMSRSKNALKDTFSHIKKEARRRGLLVNKNKTKYMK
jgi:hypothetical protein